MSSLHDELLAIKKRRGKITPRIVLTEARKVASPLHGLAAWLWDDDRAAAERYRLDVARGLIRSIEVRFVDGDGEQQTVRGWQAVRASDADEWEYDTIEEIGADPFRRKLLLNEMRRRIDELVRTYERLPEFWDVIGAVRRRSAKKKKKTTA